MPRKKDKPVPHRPAEKSTEPVQPQITPEDLEKLHIEVAEEEKHEVGTVCSCKEKHALTKETRGIMVDNAGGAPMYFLKPGPKQPNRRCYTQVLRLHRLLQAKAKEAKEANDNPG